MGRVFDLEGVMRSVENDSALQIQNQENFIESLSKSSPPMSASLSKKIAYAGRSAEKVKTGKKSFGFNFTTSELEEISQKYEQFKQTKQLQLDSRLARENNIEDKSKSKIDTKSESVDSSIAAPNPTLDKSLQQRALEIRAYNQHVSDQKALGNSVDESPTARRAWIKQHSDKDGNFTAPKPPAMETASSQSNDVPEQNLSKPQSQKKLQLEISYSPEERKPFIPPESLPAETAQANKDILDAIKAANGEAIATRLKHGMDKEALNKALLEQKQKLQEVLKDKNVSIAFKDIDHIKEDIDHTPPAQPDPMQIDKKAESVRDELPIEQETQQDQQNALSNRLQSWSKAEIIERLHGEGFESDRYNLGAAELMRIKGAEIDRFLNHIEKNGQHLERFKPNNEPERYFISEYAEKNMENMYTAFQGMEREQNPYQQPMARPQYLTHFQGGMPMQSSPQYPNYGQPFQARPNYPTPTVNHSRMPPSTFSNMQTPGNFQTPYNNHSSSQQNNSAFAGPGHTLQDTSPAGVNRFVQAVLASAHAQTQNGSFSFTNGPVTTQFRTSNSHGINRSSRPPISSKPTRPSGRQATDTTGRRLGDTPRPNRGLSGKSPSRGQISKPQQKPQKKKKKSTVELLEKLLKLLTNQNETKNQRTPPPSQQPFQSNNQSQQQDVGQRVSNAFSSPPLRSEPAPQQSPTKSDMSRIPEHTGCTITKVTMDKDGNGYVHLNTKNPNGGPDLEGRQYIPGNKISAYEKMKTDGVPVYKKGNMLSLDSEKKVPVPTLANAEAASRVNTRTIDGPKKGLSH